MTEVYPIEADGGSAWKVRAIHRESFTTTGPTSPFFKRDGNCCDFTAMRPRGACLSTLKLGWFRLCSIALTKTRGIIHQMLFLIHRDRNVIEWGFVRLVLVLFKLIAQVRCHFS